MSSLIPDEDENFGGSLVLDFRKVMTSRENDLLRLYFNVSVARLMRSEYSGSVAEWFSTPNNDITTST